VLRHSATRNCTCRHHARHRLHLRLALHYLLLRWHALGLKLYLARLLLLLLHHLLCLLVLKRWQLLRTLLLERLLRLRLSLLLHLVPGLLGLLLLLLIAQHLLLWLLHLLLLLHVGAADRHRSRGHELRLLLQLRHDTCCHQLLLLLWLLHTAGRRQGLLLLHDGLHSGWLHGHACRQHQCRWCGHHAWGRGYCCWLHG
jgi:hypothetical protein